MHFCSNCGNMYYIKLNAETSNRLTFYCRKCGDENQTISRNNIVVSKSDQQESLSYENIINKYTKLDPTLPRLYNIKCIKEKCPSNTDDKTNPEIIYIRYNHNDLKYVYLCVHCDNHWRNEF